MPPKAKASSQGNFEEFTKKLESGQTLDEGEYKTILEGSGGDNAPKQIIAMSLKSYLEKYPKLAKDILQVQLKFASDADIEVQNFAVRTLSASVGTDPIQVATALMKSCGESENRISQAAVNGLKKILSIDEVRNEIYRNLKKLNETAQSNIVRLIAEDVTFSEESADQLRELLIVAFDSAVEAGLELLGKNKKIISDDTKVVLGQRVITNLEESLKNQFQEVSSVLLVPIVSRVRLLGEAAIRAVIGIISEHVFPRFTSLSSEISLPLLRRLYDLNKFIADEKFQKSLYNDVIMTFPTIETPKPSFNFSLIEVALALFFKLATRFNFLTGNLIGRPILVTLQPSEINRFDKDETKFRVFSVRLDFISTNAKTYVEKQKARQEDLRSLGPQNDEQRRESLQLSDGIRTGYNCIHYCRVLQSENIAKERPPRNLAWKRSKKMNTKPSQFRNRKERPNSRSSRLPPNTRSNDGQRTGNRYRR